MSQHVSVKKKNSEWFLPHRRIAVTFRVLENFDFFWYLWVCTPRDLFKSEEFSGTRRPHGTLARLREYLPNEIWDLDFCVISVWFWCDFCVVSLYLLDHEWVPWSARASKNTPDLNRTRAVRIRGYPKLVLTPRTRKVTADESSHKNHTEYFSQKHAETYYQIRQIRLYRGYNNKPPSKVE